MVAAKILPDLQPLAVPLDWLTPLPGNPNKGNVTAVARMLDHFGQHKPIVVQRTGEQDGHPVGIIIAGNTTHAGARKLRWDRIAVTWTDDDDVTAKARAVSDNRASELAETDKDLLVEMLSYVADDEALLQAAGYSEEDMQKLIEPGGDPNNPRSQLDAMKFSILIECEDESHQAELLARFELEGLTVKALMT